MKEVRPLLIARGLTGFFGVFGMYCKPPPSIRIRFRTRTRTRIQRTSVVFAFSVEFVEMVEKAFVPSPKVTL